MFKKTCLFLAASMFISNCVSVFATDDKDISCLKINLVKKNFILDEKQNLDIFHGDNLNIALHDGLDFILNDNNTNFIDDKRSLNGFIATNPAICDNIKKVIECIESENLNEDDKTLEILNNLTYLHMSLKADTSINDTNGFLRFVRAMRTAYQTVISRKIAAQIINERRDEIESKMSSESVKRKISGNVSLPVKVVDLGLSVDASSSEGSSEESFYKIDNSGHAGISIGAGLKKYFYAGAGYDFEFTNTLLFYSLEEFLDTCKYKGKISNIEIRESTIRRVIDSRQEMQNMEKNLLSMMKTSIEWYLKASQIVSQSTIFKWPDITFTDSTSSKRTVKHSGTVDVMAESLVNLGMNVSVSHESMTNTIRHPYIDLLNSDCTVSDYAGNAEQVGILLKQNEMKKYNEVKLYLQNYLSDSNNGSNIKDKESLSIIISNILGDIKHYNSVLSIISDQTIPQSEREIAVDTKHKIERDWLGNGGLLHNNKGRLEMLKSAVAIACFLRSHAKTQEEIELFKKLYCEIEYLSKLQVFSKNTLKHRGKFDTDRKSSIISASGNINFSTPYTNANEIDITYSNSKGEASFDNSEDIIIKVKIPSLGDQLLGVLDIKNKIHELRNKFYENNSKKINPALGFALTHIELNFDGILDNLGLKSILSLPTTVVTENYVILEFYLTKVGKTGATADLLALPGSKMPIIKLDDEWVLKLSKSVTSTDVKTTLGISDIISLKHSKNISNAVSTIGDNTLTFLTSKYNAFAIGMDKREKNDVNSLWEKFKVSQKGSLRELFKNVNCENKNVRYELQCMWNNLIGKIYSNTNVTMKEKEELNKKARQKFENFLTVCNVLSQHDCDEDLLIALARLDDVMKLNYKYNYLLELNNIHKLK